VAIIILEVNEEFSRAHPGTSQSQCIDGIVQMIYHGFERIMAPGDSVVVPAGVEHVMRNIGTQPARVTCALKPASCSRRQSRLSDV